MRRVLLLALAVTLGVAGPAYAGDDQIVISGDVHVARGQTLDDVLVIDGHVAIDGRLEGELIAISAPVRISGTVEGDVVALTDRAVIERGARIGGDLVYADKRPRVARGATVEGETRRVDLDEISSPFKAFAARIALWLAFSVSSLALGFLLLWLAPRALEAALWTARTSTGSAIGMGLAVFFGLPVAACSRSSRSSGSRSGSSRCWRCCPLYAIGYTTSAYLLGRAIVRPPTGRALAFLAGWGILRALALVPWLGGLVWFGAAVFGLGALTVALWRARQSGVGPQGVPAGA